MSNHPNSWVKNLTWSSTSQNHCHSSNPTIYNNCQKSQALIGQVEINKTIAAFEMTLMHFHVACVLPLEELSSLLFTQWPSSSGPSRYFLQPNMKCFKEFTPKITVNTLFTYNNIIFHSWVTDEFSATAEPISVALVTRCFALIRLQTNYRICKEW